MELIMAMNIFTMYKPSCKPTINIEVIDVETSAALESINVLFSL